MKNNDKVKEIIIGVTTELINQSNGNVKAITARQIAQKANVGLGLINYHFQSKDNLITICVQRIISQVVQGFTLQQEYSTPKERLTACAIYVFDFLFTNSAISRISILGDMQNYTVNCNTANSQRGFIKSLPSNTISNEKEQLLLSFIITSVMQTAFLSNSISQDLLGYDFSQQNERHLFIKKLVDTLLV